MTPGKGQNKCKLSGQRNDQNLLADFLTFQDKAQHRNSLNSTFVLKISAIVSSNSDFAFTSVFFYLGLRKNCLLHCIVSLAKIMAEQVFFITNAKNVRKQILIIFQFCIKIHPQTFFGLRKWLYLWNLPVAEVAEFRGHVEKESEEKICLSFFLTWSVWSLIRRLFPWRQTFRRYGLEYF